MTAYLDTPLERATGKRTAKALGKLGLETVSDLLYHFPRRYETFAMLTPLSHLVEGEEASLVGRVVDRRISQSHRNRRLWMFSVTLTDGTDEVQATFFARSSGMLKGHEKRLEIGTHVLVSGKVGRYRGHWQLSHPAYQVLEDRGDVGTKEQAQALAATPTPIYPSGQGVATWTIEAALRPILDTLTSDDIPDPLPEDVRAQLGLPGIVDALRLIHRPPALGDDKPARRRFAFTEAFVLQVALAQSRSRLAQEPGTPCPPRTGGLYDRIVAGLPFQLTESQQSALADLEGRMDSDTPMNVLLQGDVGSGKTVVALLAMARAIDAGGQAALLAPTEVLAYQHFRTITNLLGPLAGMGQGMVPVDLLTGSTPKAQRRQILATCASGAPALIVGTHALLSKDVQLPGLALAVIDEQHRFGVNQRDALRASAATHPHMLVMTATPIPRTVAMTVFGDLDTVTLDQVPSGRQGVQTFIVSTGRQAWVDRVWERAKEEVDASGRVFVVCPRIDDTEGEDSRPLASVEAVTAQLRAHPLLADVGIAALHGRHSSAEKDQIMSDLVQGKTPILVATTVIEVGVDVPDATMMVIMDADAFGLSQLHQLRGRIGRGDKPGVCLVMTGAEPGSTAMRRLDVFSQTANGFILAQEDLELRQEGDILGDDQSGRHSGLKLLSVRRDGTLISQVRDAAIALVAKDPTLAEHPALAQALAAVHPDQQAYLERG